VPASRGRVPPGSPPVVSLDAVRAGDVHPAPLGHILGLDLVGAVALGMWVAFVTLALPLVVVLGRISDHFGRMPVPSTAGQRRHVVAMSAVDQL
jgi:hypothetical protein